MKFLKPVTFAIIALIRATTATPSPSTTAAYTTPSTTTADLTPSTTAANTAPSSTTTAVSIPSQSTTDTTASDRTTNSPTSTPISDSTPSSTSSDPTPPSTAVYSTPSTIATESTLSSTAVNTSLSTATDEHEPRCVERGGWYYAENLPADVRCIIAFRVYGGRYKSVLESGVFGPSVPIAPAVINSVDVSVRGYTDFRNSAGEAEACDQNSRTSMKSFVCQKHDTSEGIVTPKPTVSKVITSFDSELPVMTISLTDPNSNDFHKEDKRSVVWSLHYPSSHPRHASPLIGLHGAAEYSGMSSLHISNKMGFSFSNTDEDGDDLDVDMGLVGMAPEADYKLRGAILDKTLLRDMVGLEAYASTGQVSMKCALIELYVRRDDKYSDPNAVDESHYMGVYRLLEKIKRGEGRIPISKTKEYTPIDETSFIVKRDLFRGSEVKLLTSAHPNTSQYVLMLKYPKDTRATPAQIEYIRKHLKEIDEMMKRPQMNDTFKQLVDVRSFVDQQLIQEIVSNDDSYRKSTCFYKDYMGKFTAGPVWDFDLSLGHQWDLVKATSKLQYNRYQGIWFRELNLNPDYKCLVSCTWEQYRHTIFSTSTLLKIVDSHSSYLENAAERNFRRWDVLEHPLSMFTGFIAESQLLTTWEAQVEAMKDILVSRLTILDHIYKVDPDACDCGEINSAIP